MTLTALLVWLYGQVLVGAAVSAAAWVRLGWARWRGVARQEIGRDAYLWVATGIAAVLIGAVLCATSRVATAAIDGDGAEGRLPAVLVLALVLLTGGSGALVWGSTIGRSPAAWRLFLALSGLWLAVTLIWRW